MRWQNKKEAEPGSRYNCGQRSALILAYHLGVGKKMKYDIFISHASEDKEALVTPLANELDRMGVKVWFDKFTLKPGDSLSKSIDEGLSKSNYGIVILSKAFFGKRWPDYEYRGLLTRELHGKKVIIPLWYNIDIQDVMEFSPTLADKFAITVGEDDIIGTALSILAETRPDLFETIYRKFLYLESQKKNSQIVDLKKLSLAISDPRHDELPLKLLNRIICFHETCKKFLPVSLEETVLNFRRDINPEKEIIVWEAIVSAYCRAIEELSISKGKEKDTFNFMLKCSFGIPKEEQKKLNVHELKLFKIFSQSYPPIHLIK